MAGELVNIEMLEKLPEREKKRLTELEVVIKQDLRAFLRVGAALAEIRDNRLYRSTHFTWDEYLNDVWQLSKTYGNDQINAHKVVAAIEETTAIAVKTLPQNEAQVRPLVKYYKDHKKQPEKLAQIWEQVVKNAPKGKVTAKFVQQTLFDVVGKDVKDSTGKRRAAVRNDDTVSPAFKEAHEALMLELEREKLSRYKTSSRQSIINHLDGLRAVISESGDEFASSHWDKSDIKKLTIGGFTLYRKRITDQDDQTQYLIEKADSTMAGWQFVANYTHEEQCDSSLERLTADETSLRC